MNYHLHPKVFGTGEEISPKIDPVRRMNVKKWTERVEPMLKVFRDLLNLFKLFWRRGNYCKAWRAWRSSWSERVQQLQCTAAEQSGWMPFATSNRVISGNQRSCFHPSDINLTFNSYPDNFVCHVILKATTRNSKVFQNLFIWIL